MKSLLLFICCIVSLNTLAETSKFKITCEKGFLVDRTANIDLRGVEFSIPNVLSGARASKVLVESELYWLHLWSFNDYITLTVYEFSKDIPGGLNRYQFPIAHTYVSYELKDNQLIKIKYFNIGTAVEDLLRGELACRIKKTSM